MRIAFSKEVTLANMKNPSKETRASSLCCSVFLPTVSVCLLFYGITEFEEVTQREYVATTCSVLSTYSCRERDVNAANRVFRSACQAGPWDDGKKSSNNEEHAFSCDYTVVTALTGDRNFTFTGSAEEAGCDQYGTTCNYELAANCSGDCFALYVDGQPLGVTTLSQELSIFMSVSLIVVGVATAFAALLTVGLTAYCHLSWLLADSKASLAAEPNAAPVPDVVPTLISPLRCGCGNFAGPDRVCNACRAKKSSLQPTTHLPSSDGISPQNIGTVSSDHDEIARKYRNDKE